MLTTEAEAKTKRCQESYPACTQVTMSGATIAMSYVGGAYAVETAPAMCIGSACMAWRWTLALDGGIGTRPSKLGFCGKAGRP